MTAPATSSRSGKDKRARADSRRTDDTRRRASGRIRWRRIPGRIILALCFVLGAVALGFAVLPFSTTVDGIDLRCGPAVFEVLMPPDPAFDDVPENAGCRQPAQTRLIVSGAVLGVVLLVTAITEWRTRRGSRQRDARWLASSPSTKRRRRQARADAKAGPSGSIGTGAKGSLGPDRRSLPSSRR